MSAGLIKSHVPEEANVKMKKVLFKRFSKIYRKSRILGWALLIFYLLVFCSAPFLYYFSSKRNERLTNFGIETRGNVISTSGFFGQDVQVGYSVNGISYTMKRRYGENNLNIGDSISIIYDPQYPDNAKFP